MGAEGESDESRESLRQKDRVEAVYEEKVTPFFRYADLRFRDSWIFFYGVMQNKKKMRMRKWSMFQR